MSSPGTFHILSSIFFLSSVSWRGGKLLIALAALQLGVDALTIGLLAAAYSFLPMLVSIQVGRISDRVGARIPVILGTLSMALAAALPALSLNLFTLALCPILLGLGQLLIQVSVHNGVGTISSPEMRSTNYARLQVSASAAAFVGPLVVGLAIDRLGLVEGFILTAATGALMLLPGLMLADHLGDRTARIEKTGKQRTSDLFANAGLRRSIFTSAIVVCGLELFTFYVPIYGDSIGLSATVIGAVLAVRASAAFMVRILTGALLRRLSETAVLTAALFVGAASFAVVPVFDNVVVLFAASFVMGLSLGVATPLTQAMAYNSSPKGRTGEALGLRLFVNKAMQVVVPLGFGSLGAAFGVAPVFWANAAILLLGGAVSVCDVKFGSPQ